MLNNEDWVIYFEKLLKKLTKSEQGFTPFTQEELKARIDQAEEDFRNGRFASSEDLLSKF